MKGIIVEKVGGAYLLADDVEKPTPGNNEVLIKSLVTAMNPVDGYMQGTGLLVTKWPIVLGTDASGVVVEVGKDVTKFKVGDGAFGCTALGLPGYAPFQEYHLMNESLAFKRPANISPEQAATIGVGLLTAGLGIVAGSNVDLKPKPINENSPWYIVLGAAGSVGQYCIQVAKFCGYKVLAACSPSNNELVKSIGADATFSYKLGVAEQIAEIEKITGGNYTRVIDTSAQAAETGVGALAQNKSSDQKYFSTVNDWSPIDAPSGSGVEVCKITLGDINRSGTPHIDKVNKDLVDLIKKYEPLLESGQLKPQEYVQVGGVGVGEILKGIEAFKTHKSGKKLIVRVAEN